MRLKHCMLILLLLALIGCSGNKDPVKPDGTIPDDPRAGFTYGDTLNHTAQSPQVDTQWPSLADSPWPMAMVNQFGVARTQHELLISGHIAWQEMAHEGIIPNQIRNGIAIGPQGHIYYTDINRQLRAISATGEALWFVKEPYTPYSGPVVAADSTIYCSSFEGLLAIRPDGSVKWCFNPDTSTGLWELRPFIGIDGTLFVRTGLGRLYAISPDREILWDVEVLAQSLNCIVASPDGATLYVQGNDRHLLALEAATGHEIWRTTTGTRDLIHATVDNQGNVYFVRTNAGLYREVVSLGPDGSERWTYITHRSDPNDSVLENNISISAKGYIYQGFGGSSMIALDYNGQYRWTLSFEGYKVYGFLPIICDGAENVVALSNYSSLIFKIEESGQMLKAIDLKEIKTPSQSGYVLPSAVSADGALILADHRVVSKMY